MVRTRLKLIRKVKLDVEVNDAYEITEEVAKNALIQGLAGMGRGLHHKVSSVKATSTVDYQKEDLVAEQQNLFDSLPPERSAVA